MRRTGKIYSTFFKTATVKSIKIQGPNGGEEWVVGENREIRWSSQLLVGTNVKIELSRNNGGSWTPIIASTPNNGLYNWIVDGSNTSLGLMKITSVEYPATLDISDSNFSILPKITISTPNGGETLDAGSIKDVQWSSLGDGGLNVKMEYSLDNGGNWIQMPFLEEDFFGYADDTALETSPKWTAGPADTSNGTTIKAVFMNAGYGLFHRETGVTTNAEKYITFNNASSGSGINNVIIDLETLANYDCGFWIYIGDALSNLAVFSFLVNESGTLKFKDYSGTINVDINSTTVNTRRELRYEIDETNETYKVYVDDILIGETNYYQTAGPLFFCLMSIGGVSSKFGDVHVHSIENGWDGKNTANDGSFEWRVPFVNLDQNFVKLTCIEYPNAIDESDSVFSIDQGIAVTSPNGSENWDAGSAQTITWTSNGIRGDVKIEYYDGSNWQTIIASTPNDGSHNWTVPYTFTSQAKVRITSVKDTAISDESNNVFTIEPAPLATLEDFQSGVNNNALDTISPPWYEFGDNFATAYGRYIDRGGGAIWGRFYDVNVTQQYNKEYVFSSPITTSGIQILEFVNDVVAIGDGNIHTFEIRDASNNIAVKLEFGQTGVTQYVKLNNGNNLKYLGADINPSGQHTFKIWLDIDNDEIYQIEMDGNILTMTAGDEAFVGAVGQLTKLKLYSIDAMTGIDVFIDNIKGNW
jgi:hypothetical protein